MGSSSSTTETMCVINDLSYLEMTLDVDELDILDIAVGQKAAVSYTHLTLPTKLEV